MNQIDFNPKVARKDAYGHVTVKPTTYRGFTLDVGITVKVWNPCDQYMGRFANVKAAKAAIRLMLKAHIRLNPDRD